MVLFSTMNLKLFGDLIFNIGRMTRGGTDGMFGNVVFDIEALVMFVTLGCSLR